MLIFSLLCKLKHFGSIKHISLPEADLVVRRQMVSTWTNFALTGRVRLHFRESIEIKTLFLLDTFHVVMARRTVLFQTLVVS